LRRVLLVEPRPAYLEYLVALCGTLDLHVDATGSAREALARLEAQRFELLVAELHLPGEDARDLLRRCRSRGLHLPAIFVVDERVRDDEAALAIDDCCATLLARPIDLDTFERAVYAADARRHHVDCVHRHLETPR